MSKMKGNYFECEGLLTNPKCEGKTGNFTGKCRECRKVKCKHCLDEYIPNSKTINKLMCRKCSKRFAHVKPNSETSYVY